MSDAETPEADHLLQLQLRAGDAKRAGKPGDHFNPFKLVRLTFPAIFQCGLRYYQEEYDIDHDKRLWVEISEATANRWLGGDRTTSVPNIFDDPKSNTRGPETVNVGEFEREHFELALGIKLDDWQWRFIQGYKRGDVIEVPKRDIIRGSGVERSQTRADSED